MSETGLAPSAVDSGKIEAVLDHERWREARDELDAMASKLYTLAETDNGWIGRNLHSLAAEVSVLAEQYAQKLKAHDTLKQQLQDSLEAEAQEQARGWDGYEHS